MNGHILLHPDLQPPGCRGSTPGRSATQVLLIWLVCIVEGSEENLLAWHRMLRKARLTLGFMRAMEPDPQELNAFQLRHNQLFLPEEGVFYLH